MTSIGSKATDGFNSKKSLFPFDLKCDQYPWSSLLQRLIIVQPALPPNKCISDLQTNISILGINRKHRPGLHLEYCEQFCTPYLRKDVLALERVWRRFMRMIPGMIGLTSDERLTALGLYSLEFRKTTGRGPH